MKSRQHLVQRMPSADKDLLQKLLGFIKSFLVPERSWNHINSNSSLNHLCHRVQCVSRLRRSPIDYAIFTPLPLIVAPRSIGEGVARHLAEPCQSVLGWGTTSLPEPWCAKTSEHLRKDQRSWEANTQLEGSVSDSFFQVYQDFSFSDSFIT